MPNWVKTVVKTKPETLQQIKSKYFGDEGLDFNKIIPMPEELSIESGSRGEDGLMILYDETKDYKQKELINTVYRSLNLFHDDIDKTSRFQSVLDEYKKDKNNSKYKEIKEIGQKYFDNYNKYGFSNWYEWCVENWGTKWNCSDFQNNKDTMVYVTAWDFADKIILKLSEEFPDATFECKFSNEDYGSASGIVEIKNGEYFLQNYDLSTEELNEIWDTYLNDDFNFSNDKEVDDLDLEY